MITRPYVLLAILSSAATLVPQRVQAQATTQDAQPAARGSSSSSGTSPAAPQAASSSDIRESRILSDPLYLPLKGQVFGQTAYTLNMPRGDNFKAGANTGSFSASDNSIDQTIAYGVTNNLAVRVSLGYGSNQRDSTSAATGDVTTGNSSGFSDPTFSATYRVLDQLRSPLVLDLTGSYSPDTFVSRASGGVGDGTIARGGQTTGFSVALGREMKSFTVAGTFASTYVGQQTTDLLSNSTSSESDAHWNYSLGLTTQTRFTDRVSLNAGVTFTTVGDYGVSNIDTGNSHSYSGPDTRTLSFALNYHIVPNRLVGAFTYAYDNLTTATNTFAKAASDTAVENRIGNVVGFRLLYAF